MKYTINQDNNVIDRIEADSEEEAVNVAMELYPDIDNISIVPIGAEIADLREQANKQYQEIAPYDIMDGITNAFPRTMSKDSDIFAKDIGLGERVARIGKQAINVPLDILSNTGRSLASLPELYSGDMNKYNQGMRRTLPEERGDDALSNLVETGEGVLIDPMTHLAFTPTGSDIGEIGRTRPIGSRLSSTINKLPSVKQGWSSAIGLGAGEGAIQNAVAYADRGLPESTGEAVGNALLPTLANTLGFKFGTTPNTIKQRAGGDLENAIAPNKSVTKRFPKGMTSAGQIEKIILEPNLANVEGQNQATQVLNNLKDVREGLFERQDLITKSPIFNDPTIPELSLKRFVIDPGMEDEIISPNVFEQAIYDFIYEPSSTSLTGSKNLPSEIADYIAKFEGTDKTPRLRENLAELFDSAEGITLAQLLDARKKIDKIAEKKGLFAQSSEDLSTEAELYRKARSDINEQIMNGVANIKEQLDVLNSPVRSDNIRKSRESFKKADPEFFSGLDLNGPLNKMDTYLKGRQDEMTLANIPKEEIVANIAGERAGLDEFPKNQRSLYENYVMDDILSNRQQVIDKNSKSTPVLASAWDNKLATLSSLARGKPLAMAEGIRSGRGDLGSKQELYNLGRRLQGKSQGNTPVVGTPSRLVSQGLVDYKNEDRPIATYRASGIDDLLQTPASIKRKAEEDKKKSKK